MPDALPPADLLNEIAVRTNLQEGFLGVARVLRGVYNLTNHAIASTKSSTSTPVGTKHHEALSSHRVTSKELARYTRLPIPVLTAVRRELEKVGLLSSDLTGGIALSPAGQQFLISQLGVIRAPSCVCPTCLGHSFVIPPLYHLVLARLDALFTSMPPVDTTLDQAFATPATSLRRILLMLAQGALEGRQVILLGDDDSLAISIRLVERALLIASGDEQRTSLTSRLTVVDIDERILAHTQHVLQTEGLPPVETIKHDLRNPLPSTLLNTFDTFATDSAYTINGATLFLSRGIEALQTGGGRQIFFSYGHKPPLETVRLQQTLARLGLALESLYANFNEYVGAETLGNSSHLYQLTTTRESNSLVKDVFSGPLYTADERPAIREYSCMHCQASFEVGPGQRYLTIENLKAVGCQNCGGMKFRPGRQTRI